MIDLDGIYKDRMNDSNSLEHLETYEYIFRIYLKTLLESMDLYNYRLRHKYTRILCQETI